MIDSPDIATWFLGMNYDGPVMAFLFLERGMRVIPVGPSLAKREVVFKRGICLDGGEADVGHTIHARRNEEPVPVD